MSTSTFLHNTWYVACTSNEVQEHPLARQICGVSLVFFRDESGVIACVEDFCPHRGAPLSLGYVEHGELVCGYHGLRMGSNGQTRSMPLQRVERFPCIKSFAVIEKFGFIWIWPGDKQAADPKEIPELIWADRSDWAYGGGLYHIQCDYRLMIDNLMDLTHETYVHATSIGQKEIDETSVTTRMEGQTVVTSRFMNNICAPPFWQNALESNGLDAKAAVDRWQICRFSLPSHVMIDVGVALAGQGGPEAAAIHKASSVVVDFITPETETSMWYFWGMARNFKPDDEALTEAIRQGQGHIFAEDLEVLERQQKNLLQYPVRRLLKLDIDAGGVRARRLIEQAIEKEQQVITRQAV
jgi:vanillate O-demethylase monooxygenase subunit